ncbi:MAG: selenide, water dikinase SelD [Leptolyngbyaceae cyanobacterium MO_188.B28]|nr:selenide, water dikinase SelD [Leptolyngbyaceae cyanobacterium MO_188.B28]
MQQAPQPIEKDLVLVGGGHTHAIVLRMWAMAPLPGVRLTLITNLADTPYSGMLPCHISGLYNFDESHIDLRPLTRFANCRLFMDTAVGLDLNHQSVLCAHHPPVAYDVLSIDTGSTPTTIQVPGAAEYTVPAKPVPNLLAEWGKLTEQVAQTPQRPVVIGIVGGGVGGIELTLNMQVRLHNILKQAGQPLSNLTVHLFHRGAEIATGRNPWTRKHLQTLLMRRGIQLHQRENVVAVEKASANSQQHWVRCASGLAVACDRIFWVTNASAPDWIQPSGIQRDTAGFILVGDTLQSLSHPNVFAAGDIATMANHPRPKAGVFAVRQGKPLFHNLQRYLLDRPLKPFIPQKQFLNIIDTGSGSAIASRGPFSWESRLARRWKDWIDRNFMALFTDFPDMENQKPQTRKKALRATSKILSGAERSHAPRAINPKSKIQPLPTPTSTSPVTPYCAGCGSKIGSAALDKALKRVLENSPDPSQWPQTDNILIGLNDPDDAAVVKIPAGQAMAHTVDYFRAIVDDPFIFGQIAVNHCLSDLFAMGAEPQSALAIATLPYATESKQEEILYQLLSGANKALAQSKTPLVGGHTTEGSELALGFACNGLANPNRLLRKSGMQPGQTLILTKPLGTGVLFAADMRLAAKGRWIEGAIAAMLQSNQAAALCLQRHQATACTDVTGFGLLGHLLEMVKASRVSVTLDLSHLPVLNGTREILAQGIVSSLHPQNLQAASALQSRASASRHPDYPLLFDPQTAGGLLASIPAEEAEDCLNALHHLGYQASCCIGQVFSLNQSTQPITIDKW